MLLLPSEQSHKGSIILWQWRRSTISSACIRWTPHDEINHRFMWSCGKVSEGKALPRDQGTEAFPLAWPHPPPGVCSSLLAEPKRCPQKTLLSHFTTVLRSLYLLMSTLPLLVSYKSDGLLSRKETLFLSILFVALHAVFHMWLWPPQPSPALPLLDGELTQIRMNRHWIWVTASQEATGGALGIGYGCEGCWDIPGRPEHLDETRYHRWQSARVPFPALPLSNGAT